MKRNFLQIKIYITALVIGVGMLAPLLLIMPQSVSAVGETYTYKDSDNITMQGVNLENGSFNLHRQGVVASSSNQFLGGGRINDACGINITLTLGNNDNTGTLGAIGVSELGGGSVPAVPACGQDVINRYKGKTVSIQGSAGDVETAAQKIAQVTAFIPKDAAEKPDSIKLSVTDPSGKVIKVVTASHTTLGDGTLQYQNNFSLAPGSYKACAGAPFNLCKSFEKIAHQNPPGLTFGDLTDTRSINVTLNITGVRSAGESYTLGPADISWVLKSGGGVPQTVQTNSVDIEAVEDGASAIGDSKSTLTATIPSVDPGKYTVCVVTIKVCKDVTKQEFRNESVEFDTNKLDSFQTTGTAGKPSCDLGFFLLNYLACPLSAGFTTGYQKFNKLINEKLTVDVRTIFDTSKEPGASYNKISNILRTVSLSIVVIIIVIMIAFEAVGASVTSALALRAGLPKVIVSVLIITLLPQIAKATVLASNNLGGWIGDLILQPFQQAGFFQGSGDVTILGSLAQTGAVVAALIFLGPIGALMGVALLFAAFGLAYIVLTIWGWLIIFFFIAGSVFIALGAFKGTEKAGAIYVKNVGGLLLVQIAAPAIIAFAAVAGAVAAKAGGDAAGIAQVVAILFALATIITLFINRGGALGKVSGIARGVGKKYLAGQGGNMLAKRGINRMAERGQKLKEGTYAPKWTGAAGKQFNNATRGLYAARNAGYNPAQFGRQWREARSQDASTRSAAIMQSSQWKPIAANDIAMRVASAASESAGENDAIKYLMEEKGESFASAQSQARSAVSTVKAAGFHIGEQGLRSAGFKQMALNGSAIPTLQSGMDTINDIAHGDASTTADLVGSLKQAAAARPDSGAASFGTLYTLAMKRAAGTATAIDFRDAKVEGARNTPAHQLLGAKEGSIKEIGNALVEDMQYHVRESTREGVSPEKAAYHRQKAAENKVIQDRLIQSGAYAGVTGLAAIYDTTNRVHDETRDLSGALTHRDAINRATVKENLDLGTPTTGVKQTQVRVNTIPGTATGSPKAAGGVASTAGTGGDFVLKTEHVNNPDYDKTSPLNAEARRAQALAGLPPSQNPQEREILTGGGPGGEPHP